MLRRSVLGVVLLAVMAAAAQAETRVLVTPATLESDGFPSLLVLPDASIVPRSAIRRLALAVTGDPVLTYGLASDTLQRTAGVTVSELIARRGYALTRLSVFDPATGRFHQPRPVELASGALDAPGVFVVVTDRPYLTRQLPLSELDSDNDGLSDAVETDTGVFVSADDTGTDPLRPDSDGDGLDDGDELALHGTNPLRADSDGDGVDDGAEVAANTDPALPDPVLIARYGLDQRTGPTVTDLAGPVPTPLGESGSGHVYAGAPIPAGSYGDLAITPGQFGVSGGVAGGPGEWISDRGTELGALVNNFTVMAWVYPSTVTGRQRILGRVLAGTGGWGWGIDDGELLTTGYGIVDVRSSGAGLVADAWQHVAVTHSAIDGVRFYVNGRLVSARSDVTGDFQPSDDPWGLLGRVNHENLDGLVDEVRVYRGPMLPQQVAAFAGQLAGEIPRPDGGWVLQMLPLLLED